MNADQRNLRSKLSAFTLVELVVVVCVTSLILVLLSTAMARTGPNVRSILCLSSKRQLTQAWRMYSDDNSGKIVPNRDGANTGKSKSDACWVAGWLDFTQSTDNTNTEMLINHDKWQWGAYFGSYVKSASVFKCPADESLVNVAGQPLARVRSVSMNNYLGDLSRTWTSPSRYQACRKVSQILLPSMRFVFLDEREDSINDGLFFSDPDTSYQLVDYPAAYHGSAGAVSFADEHCEIHRWSDNRTMPVLKPGQLLQLNVNLSGDLDVRWIQQRAAGVATFP